MRLKIFALWFCKFIISLPYLHNEGVRSRQHNYIVYTLQYLFSYVDDPLFLYFTLWFISNVNYN
jgi:hypothetical protein